MLRLRRQNHELAMRLLRAREELQVSERRRTGLEAILTARLNRIGDLTGRLERAREQNRRLDEENDRLVDIIKLAPSVDAA